VVLYRENVLYSLLSEFICHSLYKFHEHDHDKLPALKARLNNLRIQINEAEFLAKLKNHVFLRMIAHNIGGLTNRYAVIKFEDFEYDSFPNLNKILGYDITGEPWPNKFIENHEQHIQNLDRIKQIYQWYKPR
jgi:hypothetical protein